MKIVRVDRIRRVTLETITRFLYCLLNIFEIALQHSEVIFFCEHNYDFFGIKTLQRAYLSASASMDWYSKTYRTPKVKMFGASFFTSRTELED